MHCRIVTLLLRYSAGLVPFPFVAHFSLWDIHHSECCPLSAGSIDSMTKNIKAGALLFYFF